MFMQANQLRVNNEQRMGIVITDEMKHEFATFWQDYAHTPMTGRDVIIKSICPQVFLPSSLFIVFDLHD
jgi:DNA helicase MCM9